MSIFEKYYIEHDKQYMISNIISHEAFDEFCEREFHGKERKYEKNFCFVQAGSRHGSDLHYEFHKGRVHLHIESYAWRGLRNYLRRLFPIAEVEPSLWCGRQDTCLTLNMDITSQADCLSAFRRIRNILEPHIQKYEDHEMPLVQTGHAGQTYIGLSSNILSVDQLLKLKGLNIPHYQRPYRWTERNVRQLLDDILISWQENRSLYRIGSVIAHDNEEEQTIDLVDGQQRITTMLLILKVLGENRDVQLRYAHNDSHNHIRENHKAIADWFDECVDVRLRESFKAYLLDRCEFVCITVKNCSEAFQMFESQNGRGKELEAYNLLKSYHIRAMEQNTQEEKIGCDIRWENAIQYDATPLILNDDNFDILKQLFSEQLFRSRRWSRGLVAPKFSKQDLDEFKGFTIDKNHQIKHPYQNPQLLQFLTAKFYQNTLKGTIATSNRFIGGDKDNISPFVNINQVIVNGKEFFDYVETYVEIYKQLFLSMNSYQLSDFKRFYYAYCLDYDCNTDQVEAMLRDQLSYSARGAARRTGDGYLRELYKSMVMVLFDRFGEKGLNMYYKTLYRLVYLTRITRSQVRRASVEDLASLGLKSVFQIISQAKTLTDLRELERISNTNLASSRLIDGLVPARIYNFIIKR